MSAVIQTAKPQADHVCVSLGVPSRFVALALAAVLAGCDGMPEADDAGVLQHHDAGALTAPDAGKPDAGVAAGPGGLGVTYEAYCNLLTTGPTTCNASREGFAAWCCYREVPTPGYPVYGVLAVCRQDGIQWRYTFEAPDAGQCVFRVLDGGSFG